MQVLVLLSAALSTVSAARLSKRDQVISANVRNSATSANLGTDNTRTTINPGVAVWLSGLGAKNTFGVLENFGRYTVSQTDYIARGTIPGGQTSNFVGHTITNGILLNHAGAEVSLNDYGSASAPTYDYYLYTMQNNGSLQFCGRGDTGGSTYQLYCDVSCYNYGTIDWQQYTRALGASFNWRNAAFTPQGGTVTNNIYNYGLFRLRYVNFQVVQNIYGDGCFAIGTGAILYFQDGSGTFNNVARGPTFPNQSIYFSDGASGVLHMDTATYSYNSNFGPQVYGFGPGKAIEFYQTIDTFGYDTTTGILTVAFIGGNQVFIKLGLGYTAALFTQAKNPIYYNTGGYNAIFYSGAIPTQTVPGKCVSSLIDCGDPALTAAAAIVSSTSTTAASTTTSAPTTTTAAATSPTTTGVITSASQTLPITCTCPAPSLTVTITATT